MGDGVVGVNGEEVLLDVSGALWWPAERTLALADLHFEKGSSFARRGQLLPPYDTRATLKRIETLIVKFSPARVIALGDSFHDGDAGSRLDEEERARLLALGAAAEWVWIAGNHDPVPPAWLKGRVVEEIAIGGLVFRHEPRATSCTGEIAGHLHPCATVARGGMRRRCFVSDGTRMVMPAFGAYAGGLHIREPVLRALFARNFLAYLLGTRRVYAIAA